MSFLLPRFMDQPDVEYRTLEVQHEELRTASLQALRKTEKGPGNLIRLIPLTLNRSPTRLWHSARLSVLDVGC